MVTEQGDVWACGKGEHGVLGLGTDVHQLLPALVGVADEVFDGEAVVLVAAGREHTACVSMKGTLWSWGNGEDGRLGHGDEESRQRPQRLHRDMHGGSPAVMVSCGNLHMLVLTTDGVWSCGFGGAGRLGHGDTASQLVLTLVGAEGFRGGQIVMVAAGVCHSVALGAEGSVWTWGEGSLGRLGHNNQENRLVPTLLAGEALGGAAGVVVAAGGMHTVVVTRQGALWVWGRGLYGQLGLGDEGNRLAPERVGSEEYFGGAHVITAHCGLNHTLAITKDGALWTFGIGTDGALDHTGRNNRLVPTRIEAHHFGNAKIVCAAAGHSHSAAVTEHGILNIPPYPHPTPSRTRGVCVSVFVYVCMYIHICKAEHTNTHTHTQTHTHTHRETHQIACRGVTCNPHPPPSTRRRGIRKRRRMKRRGRGRGRGIM